MYTHENEITQNSVSCPTTGGGQGAAPQGEAALLHRHLHHGVPRQDGQVFLPGVRVHVAGGGDEAQPPAGARLFARGPQQRDGRQVS